MPTVREMSMFQFEEMINSMVENLHSQIPKIINNSDLIIFVPCIPDSLNVGSDTIKYCGIEIDVIPGMEDNEIIIGLKDQFSRPGELTVSESERQMLVEAEEELERSRKLRGELEKKYRTGEVTK